MRIRKEKIEAAMDVLRDVHTAAKLEGAAFLAPGERIPFSAKSQAFTADVRDATAAYRNAYILEPLEDAFQDLRRELDRAYGKEERADADAGS